MISDVLAQLGLKALALDWPRRALVFKILELGHGPKPGQNHSMAWPGDVFQKDNKIKIYINHYINNDVNMYQP